MNDDELAAFIDDLRALAAKWGEEMARGALAQQTNLTPGTFDPLMPPPLAVLFRSTFVAAIN